jgi:hypothetical protein
MIAGPTIAQRAKEQLIQLTGLEPDTVAGLTKDKEGWHVAVILLEMKCIPDSDDVLAVYDALLDDEGNLVGYQRTRRYYRGHVGEAAE